ncbi:MAG: hypothetical protein ACFWT6_03715 [Virgibacillus proomii]
MKLHSVGVFFHLLLNVSTTGYDLKALKRIGYLGAVFSHLDPFVPTQALEVAVLRHLTYRIEIDNKNLERSVY